MPSTNKVYVRTLKLFNDQPDNMPGLSSASEAAGPALFEDPLEMLAKMKL